MSYSLNSSNGVIWGIAEPPLFGVQGLGSKLPEGGLYLEGILYPAGAFAGGLFRMLSKHERYYALGMDALVIVCSRNTNVTMVWAWML